MKKNLSIIIPIYNIHPQIIELTNRCLKSVKKFTNNYELILIDNKDAEKWIKESDIYIKNKINNGNGSAWNQGAKLAHGQYLCFMDNDVEVTKNWSISLIKLLKNDNIAVAFPLSKNKEDDDFFERLCGFCWFVKKDLFWKIGGIDESYGLANFEDTSFFSECKLRNYMLKCSRKSKINHWSRATCDRVKEVSKLYSINEKKYFDKYKVLPLLD